MEFSRSKKGIIANQRKYALEIISELGLGSAKPVWTPLEANVKLTVPKYDKIIGKKDGLLEDKGQYQSTESQPVPTITKKSHWEAAVRVVKYIKRESGLGILLSSTRSNKLSIFCDADWASCPNTRKSMFGFLIKYEESLISWKSKNKVLYLKAQLRQSTET
uniref:Uncharacterized mitochondrial protein AtMg00810-like n=1 Tax=Nicotiana tabacum TaxID=4097 RepID=A0A1S4BQL4_TOBAC|nr:PREDICTED: uncharacterized mitochondrial protein AtMg00810-like [Nicotiana tabacum]